MTTRAQAGVPAVTLVVPGRIDARTGGSIYDRRVADGLRDRGWSVRAVELDPGFPFPTPGALRHAAAAFDSIDDGATVIVDGLALSVLADVAERAASRLTIVALIHLPLAWDIGLGAAAPTFADGEARALACASLIVTTGQPTVHMLSRYNLPRERVVVIEPGTDRKPLSGGSTGDPVRLLCVATLNPLKGHELLLGALAALSDVPWRLLCAGNLTRDPDTVTRVRRLIEGSRLGDRITLAGELDEDRLDREFAQSDLFVLATRQETYGMAVAEALAHGVPVISTATGAIPQLVGRDAGIVVPPGDERALTVALQRVLTDGALRDRLRAGARQARGRLATWDDTVDRMATALESIQSHG